MASGLRLNHIARETADVQRLAIFYEEVLGFQRIKTPNFGDFEVVWLSLPSGLSLHLVERDPSSKLQEGPPSLRDPSALPRGHHLAFAVPDFDAFVHDIKERGIKTFEKTQPDRKTKQVFFFDPDGNGLEVASLDLGSSS